MKKLVLSILFPSVLLALTLGCGEKKPEAAAADAVKAAEVPAEVAKAADGAAAVATDAAAAVKPAEAAAGGEKKKEDSGW